MTVVSGNLQSKRIFAAFWKNIARDASHWLVTMETVSSRVAPVVAVAAEVAVA